MKYKLRYLVVICALFNNLTSVYGQGIFVVPDDQKILHETSLFDPAAGTFILMNSAPARSYCCEAYSEANVVSYISAATVGATDLFTAVSAKYRGSSGLRLPASGGTLSGKDRVCFYADPSVLEGNGFAVKFTLGFGIGGMEVGNRISTKCQQTTLVGGYNTNLNELNFLEVTNTESLDTITAWLVGVNRLGVTVFRRSFTVNPEGRFDVDIHSIVGSAVYGTLFLSHDGAPGALKAHLAEYKITSASPFTFELSTRDQLTLIKP